MGQMGSGSLLGGLTQLALARFGQLFPREHLSLQASTASDRTEWFQLEDASFAPPFHAEEIDDSIRVRAEFLSWLCRDHQAQQFIEAPGLHLFGACITGVLDLQYVSMPFPLRIVKCAFNGPLSLKNVTVPTVILSGCRTGLVFADGAKIAQNLLLNAGFHARGEVSVRAAEIGDSFRADSARFQNPRGQALVCDRARIGGTMHLSHALSPSVYMGDVRVSSVVIGSNLECTGGRFLNPGRETVTGERLRVSGGVFLRDKFRSRGTVNLNGAIIGSALDCRDGQFNGRWRGQILPALRAESAQIGTYVLIDGAVSVFGEIKLWGVKVGRGVRFRLAQLERVDLRHARIEGLLDWQEVRTKPSTSLDLTGAVVETIEDDERSWPNKGKLSLDGLRYENILSSSVAAERRLEWVKRDLSRPPQAFRQLAQFYLARGETQNAKKVFYELENELTSRQIKSAGLRVKPLLAIWRFLLRWIVGYGYRLYRAFICLLILVVAGGVISYQGYKHRVITPTDKAAYATLEKRGTIPPSYQRFSATIFSLEHSLPGLTLGVSGAWSANERPDYGANPLAARWVRVWFWFQQIAGSILSVFYLAGLGGLTRSDK